MAKDVTTSIAGTIVACLVKVAITLLVTWGAATLAQWLFGMFATPTLALGAYRFVWIVGIVSLIVVIYKAIVVCKSIHNLKLGLNGIEELNEEIKHFAYYESGSPLEFKDDLVNYCAGIIAQDGKIRHNEIWLMNLVLDGRFSKASIKNIITRLSGGGEINPQSFPLPRTIKQYADNHCSDQDACERFGGFFFELGRRLTECDGDAHPNEMSFAIIYLDRIRDYFATQQGCEIHESDAG